MYFLVEELCQGVCMDAILGFGLGLIWCDSWTLLIYT